VSKSFSVFLRLVLIVASVSLLSNGHAAPITFFDDFNRPDGTVGNGWLNTSGNINGNLILRNGELSASNSDGAAGIYRPIGFSAPVTVEATIKENNGFGGLLRRYDSGFSLLSDGSLGSGYGIRFSRSDQNYNNSTIFLQDNGNTIASILTPFQFGSQIQTNFTWQPNGSINGILNSSGNTFNFSFGPQAIQSTGSNLAIVESFTDSRSPVLTHPRVDDVKLTYDGVAMPPRQIVFLNFDSAHFDDFGSRGNGAFVPASFSTTGLSLPINAVLASKEDVKNLIISKIGALFLPYGVDVVTGRPASGEYSEIAFSDRSAFSSEGGIRGLLARITTNGVAERVDIRNPVRNDRAIVFGPVFPDCIFAECFANELTNVAAHEIGHLLGLIHLNPDGYLMTQNDGSPSGTARIFGTGAPVYSPEQKLGVTQQNDRYELFQSVGGSLSPSYYGDPTDLDTAINSGTFHVSGIAGSFTFYKFHLFLIQNTDNDVLPLEIFYADEISRFPQLNYAGLIVPGARIMAVAASSALGDYDIFGLHDITELNWTDESFEHFLTYGLPLPGQGSSDSLPLFLFGGNGEKSLLATLTVSQQSIPEPPTLLLLLIAIVILNIVSRRFQTRKYCNWEY